MFTTKLNQRGRASIEFLAALGGVSFPIRQQLDQDIAAAGINADSLPDDLDERQAVMDEALKDSKAFGLIKLTGDWWSRSHGHIAIDAFEEVADEIEPKLKQLDTAAGEAEISLDPELEIPNWWSDHWIHRTTGGWDGHPYMGYVHGEIIHRKMVAVVFGDIFKQRREVMSAAPKSDYTDILDMGCSSGHNMVALQQVFPDAQLTGVDLSARMLEHAYRVAKLEGWSWKLFQQDCSNTQFENESFDLVAGYIIIHEMPTEVTRASFNEAYRLLRPGGDLIMSDMRRFSEMDKMEIWHADYDASYGGEPFARESQMLDFEALARDAGFETAQITSAPPRGYPHYVVATKPK